MFDYPTHTGMEQTSLKYAIDIQISTLVLIAIVVIGVFTRPAVVVAAVEVVVFE